MSTITVLAFDLSTACVGVVASVINKDTKEPILVKSCPIIPKRFSPEELGYRKSKKRLPTSKSGEFLNTYYKDGETTISKSEKQRRDREVRTKENLFVLDYIGKQISTIINAIRPDVIIVEKNEIFNGILTSVLLGKVMGVLIGIASSHSIPLKEFKVSKVRSIIDLNKATRDLVESISEEELKKVPDVTKRALRKLMEKKYGQYGLECKTDDESDACVVFNYWLESEFE